MLQIPLKCTLNRREAIEERADGPKDYSQEMYPEVLNMKVSVDSRSQYIKAKGSYRRETISEI